MDTPRPGSDRRASSSAAAAAASAAATAVDDSYLATSATALQEAARALRATDATAPGPCALPRLERATPRDLPMS